MKFKKIFGNSIPKNVDLARRIRISSRNYQHLIAELTQAGMLERLTPKSQEAIFQLYPKPYPKPTQSRPEIRHEWVQGKALKTDGEYWYSHNHQYRCPMDDHFPVERRQRGGTWKRVTDFHKSILRAIGILFAWRTLWEFDPHLLHLGFHNVLFPCSIRG